jgi:DNA mismatch repair protein MutS
MTFHSILFRGAGDVARREERDVPEFFHDLNLDQVVEAITADWKDYGLAPFYYSRPTDLDAVAYRQEVMEDLDDKGLTQAIAAFSGQMRAMRNRLDHSKKLSVKYAIERSFLGAVEIYVEGVERLSRDLSVLGVKSRGMRAFREYLTAYGASAPFRTLRGGDGKPGGGSRANPWRRVSAKTCTGRCSGSKPTKRTRIALGCQRRRDVREVASAMEASVRPMQTLG